jgi:hypothetical protein
MRAAGFRSDGGDRAGGGRNGTGAAAGRRRRAGGGGDSPEKTRKRVSRLGSGPDLDGEVEGDVGNRFREKNDGQDDRGDRATAIGGAVRWRARAARKRLGEGESGGG